ncbi:hypothetical protein N7532_011244 [Penicillium argentinense]|uniref:Uncharacterized protein n=1 Tax=Penicillium argentinense TaxID=1131581 RepID=A0A9W9JUS6_9EURO|nr:uncharacterized protein N7532_011244 [Penicillium argentinense]KAJ5082201.1 hypothetical protein N7532_011244 [Penicillium argentinense]
MAYPSHGYPPRSYYDYPPESYRPSRRSPSYDYEEPIRDDSPRHSRDLVRGHRHHNYDDHRDRRHHHHDHGHHGHHGHHDHDHDRHRRDSHGKDPHHKEHLAEGAIAAAAAAELAHKYRKKEGEDVSSGWGAFRPHSRCRSSRSCGG